MNSLYPLKMLDEITNIRGMRKFLHEYRIVTAKEVELQHFFVLNEEGEKVTSSQSSIDLLQQALWMEFGGRHWESMEVTSDSIIHHSFLCKLIEKSSCLRKLTIEMKEGYNVSRQDFENILVFMEAFAKNRNQLPKTLRFVGIHTRSGSQAHYYDRMARVLARSGDLHTLSFYDCECWLIHKLCGGAADITNFGRIEIDAKFAQYDLEEDFQFISDGLGSVMLGSNNCVELALASCPSSIVVPAVSRYVERTGRFFRRLDISVYEDLPNVNELANLLRNLQGLTELSIAGYVKDDEGWSELCASVPSSLRSFHVHFTYGGGPEQQYISGGLFAKQLGVLLRKTELEKLDLCSCDLRNALPEDLADAFAGTKCLRNLRIVCGRPNVSLDPLKHIFRGLQQSMTLTTLNVSSTSFGGGDWDEEVSAELSKTVEACKRLVHASIGSSIYPVRLGKITPLIKKDLCSFTRLCVRCDEDSDGHHVEELFSALRKCPKLESLELHGGVCCDRMISIARHIPHFRCLRELKMGCLYYARLDNDRIQNFLLNFAQNLMQNTTLTKFETGCGLRSIANAVTRRNLVKQLNGEGDAPPKSLWPFVFASLDRCPMATYLCLKEAVSNLFVERVADKKRKHPPK